MRKSRIHYNPAISVKENAEKCGVSESAVRKYIRAKHIDRQKDTTEAKRKVITELREENHDMSISEMMRLTGYSDHTIRKYLYQQDNSAKIDTLKVSKIAEFKAFSTIKSVSDNQHEILYNILRLYVKKQTFDCDFTYSIGNFYKYLPAPALKYDKYPQVEGVLPLEEAEKIADGSLHSVMVDLPFIIRQPYNNNEKSKIALRFDCFATAKELYAANDYMLDLSLRVLEKGGILVMKTMDVCYNGQVWVSDYLFQQATSLGFEMLDKFILISNARYLFFRGEQRHARKYHCYFLVFKKK